MTPDQIKTMIDVCLPMSLEGYERVKTVDHMLVIVNEAIADERAKPCDIKVEINERCLLAEYAWNDKDVLADAIREIYTMRGEDSWITATCAEALRKGNAED